jgi:NAD(P)-dependent dehydrogenase (short-subunit alcohol dehydrogenase family)
MALFDLTGKVALVTGCNSGIGLGMADALAAAGASVCVWGTSETKNGRAEEQLRKHGRPVLALACDVADEAALDGAFAHTVAPSGAWTPASPRRAWAGARRSPPSPR